MEPFSDTRRPNSLEDLSGTMFDPEIAKGFHALVTAGDVAFYGGYLLPAIVAPTIYLVGVAAGDPSAARAGPGR